MDSLTQAVFGAGIAGAVAPAGERRRAMLIGAALGTLPDLDVLIDFGDPVSNMTRHRGFSHSLFVLPLVACLIWATMPGLFEVFRKNRRRWFAVVFLALVTHPLLDAHTAYGTQLLWPMSTPPVMWSTLFIIDPLYTLPLLAGVIWAWRTYDHRPLVAALVISTAYIGWSWVAKSMVEEQARTALAADGLAEAPIFSTPAPLTTLLWRVVVLTDDGYLEGLHSLVADNGTMSFDHYASDIVAMQEADSVWSVRRLRWFARDFLRASVEGGKLVLTDLRMGHAGNYAFAHAVAETGNPHWKAIHPIRVASPRDAARLDGVWDRIWQAPPDLRPLQTTLPELGLVRGPDAYYLSRRDGEWGTRSKSTILRVDPDGAGTTAPEWVVTEYDESDFYYSHARRQACFVSNRASGQFLPNDDIWCMPWTGDAWGEPVPMPPPINSEAAEFSPVIRPNGDIYFASDRDGGTGYGDIYRAWPSNDGWAIERLGSAINSAGGEWNLDISPDGELMIFEASHRSTNRTVSGDLYISRWDGTAWSQAVPIHALNTDGSDLMARFTDGWTIVYASSVAGDVELKKTNRAVVERALRQH